MFDQFLFVLSQVVYSVMMKVLDGEISTLC